MENPVSVYLHNGRNDLISTTASFCVSDNTNHINIKKRALVDILRSIAHELTHNRQREIGKIVPDVPVQNINGELENEADSFAGAMIKSYVKLNKAEDIYDI